MADLPFHEAANIFPLDDEHTDELAKDIKDHGQHVAIQLLDGKILDGRRRWMACKIAGVKPITEVVETDDPVAYVLSMNLHRRHLTVSQAAMCAARARDLYAKAAKERQRLSEGRGKKGSDNCPDLIDEGKASDKAGEVFGISGKSVDRARKIIDDAIPEVMAAVDAGKITVNRGATIASHSPKLQKDLLASDLAKEPNASPRAKPDRRDPEPSEGELAGVGVVRANEAINCLKRIPKNDRLRKRGFQIVTDWIRHNK